MQAKRISSVLNEEPFVFEIQTKSYSGKPKGKRIFKVYPPVLSKMAKVSAYLEGVEGVKEMFLNKDYSAILYFLSGNYKVAKNVLAIYLSRYWWDKWLVRKFIDKNINSNECATLVSDLVEFSNLEDFYRTIIFLKRMSLMNPAEIIAPENNKEKVVSTGL